MVILVLLFGLVLGSFIGALSYRLPRGEKISNGRSRCPDCKKQIAWYDNIPVLSYLVLAGKCRNCKKHISLRYPIIELSTSFLFTFVFLLRDQITGNLSWMFSDIVLGLIVILIIAFIAMTILIIDSEHQIIPDELVFVLLGIVVFVMIVNGFTSIYYYLASGFIGAMFLLLIHLFTLGRGMGLGDVKLAIVLGTILGPANTVIWLFLSFILGGFIGAFLLILKKAGMKDKIAFGPFLIVSFFVVALFAQQLFTVLFPYL